MRASSSSTCASAMRRTSRLGRLPVAPQRQQAPISSVEKPRRRAASDESQLVDVALAVVTIIVCAPRGRAQETDRLVVADHLGGDAARRRRSADIHATLSLDLPMVGRSMHCAELDARDRADEPHRSREHGAQGPRLRHVRRSRRRRSIASTTTERPISSAAPAAATKFAADPARYLGPEARSVRSRSSRDDLHLPDASGGAAGGPGACPICGMALEPEHPSREIRAERRARST